MSTISFQRTGASSEEQQMGFAVDSGLSVVNNQIGFREFFSFFGGDVSSASILTAARTIVNGEKTSTPLTGGTLTINSESVGSYDYKVANTTTVSGFSASDWFTSTQDTHSSWICINGDLTINSGQTFIPSVRKLFTVVYVTGNLVINGSISMTGRGANHSGTGTSGGYTAPVDIRIGTGSFSSGGTISNPQIPGTGGAGGAVRSTDGANNGTTGTNGGTGGGGSGYAFSSGTAGSGSDGTCFSGGSGGGGAYGGTGTNAGINGGAGGNGSQQTGSLVTGGAGNPGGTLKATAGADGTGGTLIIIVEGSLSGSGSVVANGVAVTRFSGTVPGGATGAGSVNVLFGTNPSGVTVTASGGAGQSGGNGGGGTARKFALNGN
jgi:hypothetical protein